MLSEVPLSKTTDHFGAVTFSIMTLSIKTLNIIAISITMLSTMALSIMTLCIKCQTRQSSMMAFSIKHST
jgi:hypothetical protein